MKITHVSCLGPSVLYRLGGGIQRRVRELALAQKNLGHDVSIVSTGDADGDAEWAGVKVRQLKAGIHGVRESLLYQLRAVKAIRHDDSDVFHFHSLPEAGLLSAGIAGLKVLNFDYFDFRRASRYGVVRAAYRKIISRYDLLLPCSEYNLERAQDLWSFEASKVRVLYNGVNTTALRPDATLRAAERRRLGLGDEVAVLFVGRICRQKGTDVLLDAFGKARERSGNLRLVLAGPYAEFGGDTDDRLFWEAAMRKVDAIHLGSVDEDRLVSVFNAADIFTLPTRDLEMFGMAAAEAQACGLPVIATNHGGLLEVVRSDAGVLVPVGDATALAKEFVRLAEDAHLRARLGEAARRGIERFAWPQIAERSIELYEAARKQKS